jgi:hypothetical protein
MQTYRGPDRQICPLCRACAWQKALVLSHLPAVVLSVGTASRLGAVWSRMKEASLLANMAQAQACSRMGQLLRPKARSQRRGGDRD